MAKRKTPKSEKVIDLKPEAKEITKEELARIQALVGAINQGRSELGTIEMDKHSLLHEVSMVQAEISKFQKELTDKYGTCNVNIATGELKREEDEQANS
tara:strand:+ start:332 stop:628 length:297 start_codon:yes stop_codon:yes gene_type:complete